MHLQHLEQVRHIQRPGGGEAEPVRHCRQIPELPRRCEPSRWVSTMPMASISANMVVGPTNLKPARFSALDSATDSGLCVGISARVAGCGVCCGRCDQISSDNPPAARRRRWPARC